MKGFIVAAGAAAMTSDSNYKHTASGIVPKVLKQHAGEASTLWRRRQGVCISRHNRFVDLVHYDRRLDDNLYALTIVGQSSYSALDAEIAIDQRDGLFAAFSCALRMNDKIRLLALLERYADAEYYAHALTGALSWHLELPLAKHLCDTNFWAQVKRPIDRLILLAAVADIRADPGRLLDLALLENDSAIRQRAYRAIGEYGLRQHVQPLRDAMANEQGLARHYASCAAYALSEDRRADPAFDILAHALCEDSEAGWQAAKVLMTLADLPDADRVVCWLSKKAPLHPLLVIATGLTGNPRYAEWLLEVMKRPSSARLAFAAFSLITDIDATAYEDQTRRIAAGEGQAAPAKSWIADYFEDWPLPDIERVSSWWQTNKDRFVSDQRYVLGKARSFDALAGALLNESQAVREIIAAHLRGAMPLLPLAPVFAPASAQMKYLHIDPTFIG